MKVRLATAVATAGAVCCLCLSSCTRVEGRAASDEHGTAHEGGAHHGADHKIVVTTPVLKDVISTQRYVSQIHSRRHIEVRALERGYLEKIPVNEGQSVSQGDTMFRIVPTLFQARLEAEKAEAQLAQIEYDNTQNLSSKGIVSQQELALSKAKLTKAEADLELARAEFNFTEIKAPFDGIIDRLHHQDGSLIEEGEVLTTLSDNSVMWVYFNVPEARYLQYKADLEENDRELRVELVLADGNTFPHRGVIGAIEADFNNETGNIAFRADFPNPDGLLRHGQTGTVLIHRTLNDAVVIPQRATFEILAKQYVYVVEPVERSRADHDSAGETHDDAGDELWDDDDDGDDELGDDDDAWDDEEAEHEESDDDESDDERSDVALRHVAHLEGPEHGEAEHEESRGSDHHTGLRTGVVRQREIRVKTEMEDIFVVDGGLKDSEQIVFEGVQQVRDGDTVEYEFRASLEILADLKNHAE